MIIKQKKSFKNKFSLLIMIGMGLVLTGCASNPTSYIPTNQRVMFMAEQQVNSHKTNNKSKSKIANKRDKQTSVIPGAISDYYLSLEYKGQQEKLDVVQVRKLTELINRIPQSSQYTCRMYAGPGIKKHTIKKLTLVEKRIQYLQTFLKTKVSKVESYYEPNLAAGQINLQFISPTG